MLNSIKTGKKFFIPILTYVFIFEGTTPTKHRYHRSETDAIYSCADQDNDDAGQAQTMSKESIASSQNVLPPPDTYLDNYEQNRMSKPHLLIDPSCKISDELVYAAVGTPMGPPGCENYSYQQHISTFGTMLPRN